MLIDYFVEKRHKNTVKDVYNRMTTKFINTYIVMYTDKTA